jgi:hypothetical protein
MHALPMRATTFLLLSLRLSKFLSLTNKNDSMDLKKIIFSLNNSSNLENSHIRRECT